MSDQDLLALERFLRFTLDERRQFIRTPAFVDLKKKFDLPALLEKVSKSGVDKVMDALLSGKPKVPPKEKGKQIEESKPTEAFVQADDEPTISGWGKPVGTNWGDEMDALEKKGQKHGYKTVKMGEPLKGKPDLTNIKGAFNIMRAKVDENVPLTSLEKFKVQAGLKREIKEANARPQEFTYNVEATTMASSMSDLVYYFFEDKGVTFNEIAAMLKSGKSMKEIRATHNVPEWRAIPAFNPNQPTRVTADHIRSAVEMHRVTDLIVTKAHKIQLPAMGTIEQYLADAGLEEEVSEWVKSLLIFYQNEKIPRTFDSAFNVASYNPKFEIIKPHTGVLAHCEALRIDAHKQGNNEMANDIMAEMIKLRDVASENYFGNGSIKGMLGRLKACYEVAKSVHPQDLSQIIKVSDVFGQPEPIEWNFTSYLQGVVSMNASEGVITNKVNLEADAGIIWRNAKKNTTSPMDFQMADDIMNALMTISGLELLRSLPSARLLPMKPKSEVYRRDEFETKTRNIFPANAFCMLPLQTVLTLAFKDMNNFLQDPGIIHLLGFSPFHGGTQDFVEKVVKSKRNVCLTYSDNVYGKSGNIYYSVDGSKQEATITIADVIAFNKYLYEETGLDKSPMAVAWFEYLVNFVPYCIVDTHGQLGEYQFLVKGMVSGATGTTYYNTWKMGQFCKLMGEKEVIVKRGKEFKFSNAAEENMKKVGLVLKIETAQVIDEDVLSKEYLTLDLLGYDGYQLKHGVQGYLPVLAQERIRKAIMFPRHEFGLHHSKEVAEMLIYVRYRALYLMGGWSNQTLALGLRSFLAAQKKALPSDEVRIDELLLSIRDVLSEVDIVDSMLSFVDKFNIPSMYEVIALGLDHQQAENFIKHSMLTDPQLAFVSLDEEFKRAATITEEGVFIKGEPLKEFMQAILEIVPTKEESLPLEISYTPRTLPAGEVDARPIKRVPTEVTRKTKKSQVHEANTNVNYSKDLLEYLTKTPVFKWDVDVDDSRRARAIIANFVSRRLQMSSTELIKSFGGDKKLSTTTGSDIKELIKTFG